ncbi:MAG: hypothetical protein F4X29_03030 [Rhodothermaceae bacterium]|nr:hypothetical protein [Rhodothermaceae bacterium]
MFVLFPGATTFTTAYVFVADGGSRAFVARNDIGPFGPIFAPDGHCDGIFTTRYIPDCCLATVAFRTSSEKAMKHGAYITGPRVIMSCPFLGVCFCWQTSEQEQAYGDQT